MTVYEYLMGKADECNKKAQMFKKKGEKNLTVFFENACDDYKNKALNLTAEEAGKERL